MSYLISLSGFCDLRWSQPPEGNQDALFSFLGRFSSMFIVNDLNLEICHFIQNDKAFIFNLWNFLKDAQESTFQAWFFNAALIITIMLKIHQQFFLSIYQMFLNTQLLTFSSWCCAKQRFLVAHSCPQGLQQT